jgi:hypothetical protein
MIYHHALFLPQNHSSTRDWDILAFAECMSHRQAKALLAWVASAALLILLLAKC